METAEFVEEVVEEGGLTATLADFEAAVEAARALILSANPDDTPRIQISVHDATLAGLETGEQWATRVYSGRHAYIAAEREFGDSATVTAFVDVAQR